MERIYYTHSYYYTVMYTCCGYLGRDITTIYIFLRLGRYSMSFLVEGWIYIINNKHSKITVMYSCGCLVPGVQNVWQQFNLHQHYIQEGILLDF